MKIVKIGAIAVGALLLLALIGAVGYKLIYSQGIAEAFEVNSPELETRVLIATQGSAFKNALVAKVAEELGKKAVYIQVVDVTALPKTKVEGWSALVVINTCESGKMQKDAQNYLTQVKAREKVVLLTTSGSGTWTPEEFAIDSISSASKKESVQSLAAEILKRLELILETA